MNVSTFLSPDIKTKTLRIINTEDTYTKQLDNTGEYVLDDSEVKPEEIIEVIFVNDLTTYARFNVISKIDGYLFFKLVLFPGEIYTRKFYY